MTKSSKVIIGVLAAAVIVIGIGYAAITSQVLNITGTLTASATDADFNVKFIEPITKGTDNDGEVIATITGDQAAAFSVSGLKIAGETASATYTIQNASAEGIAANLVAAVTAPAETDDTDYFTIEVTQPEKVTLNPGDTTTVTVTATLIKTPITEVSHTVGVTITGTAAEVAE